MLVHRFIGSSEFFGLEPPHFSVWEDIPSSFWLKHTVRQFTEVKPHHTSQKCSSCNEVVPKKLSVRTHDCPYCGLVIDRDHNAAINIKKAAVALRGGVVVTNTPETPAQTGTEARNPINPGERVTSPSPSGWGN